MRKPGRAFAGALALATAVVLLASGCTGASSPSSSAGASGTLRVGIWGVNSDIASIKAAAKGFQKANPNVTLKFEKGDCGPDYAACKTLIAGKNMPDVIVAGSWDYYDMVRDHVLTDIAPYLKKNNVSTSDFTPAVIKAITSKDGSIHGLPMGYNTQSLFYNTDMFKAAGLALPPADGSYTYNDLREWAKKLTLDKNGNNAESPNFDPSNIKQYGYYNRVALSNEPGYGPVLAANGGNVLSGADRSKCTIDTPASISSFQYLQDMMWKDHSAITPQLEQEQPGYLRWVDGKVAMQQGSHEQVGIVRDTNPSLKFDMAALPKGKKGNATLLQIHIWGVYAGSKQQSTGASFVKYMATDGSGKQMGLIPAYKDRALGKDFAKAPGEPKHLVEAQIDPAKWPLTYVNVDPSHVWAAISGQDGFGPALEDIIADRKTAKQALGGICGSKLDAVIKAQH